MSRKGNSVFYLFAMDFQWYLLIKKGKHLFYTVKKCCSNLTEVEIEVNVHKNMNNLHRLNNFDFR